jgi:hypothetical protein
MMPPPSTGNPEQDRINMEDFRRQEENMRRFYDNFAGVGTLNPVQVAEDNRAMQTVGIGSIGMMQAGQMGPLSGLGQYLNQELAQENQGEVNEFIGEVGDMANQRFGVDLGSVGQRPMFDVGRPVQAYRDGGAAFPDLSGDGKITQKDILMGRGVIEKEYGGPVGMAQGGDIFEAVTGIPFSSLNNLPPAQREIALQKFEQYQLAQETERAMQQAQALQKNVEGRGAQLEGMQEQMRFLDRGVQDLQSFQEGGMAMPMPPQAPPMPMPAPEQPPMPMEDQLDPNVVQSALAQAAGGIGDLDQAQNYEQVMNTMRGDQATVEERRQELAGVVGPGDAGQTPESVLTLVQPVMMLANVDQGIGQLAQQEMTQPMEGPMAGGIMSTVPEPPMMEAGGDAPVNFNKGGEVRPIQYLAPGGVAGNKPFASLKGQPISPFIQQAMAVRQPLLSDPASLERQKDLTKAQILFDLAQTGLAFAAPMEGERPGLSPAERLAMAARSTRLPEKIGARAQALGDKEAAQEAQDKAIMASAITSAETRFAAQEKAARDAAAATAKAEADAKKLEKENAFKLAFLREETALESKKNLKLQANKYELIAKNDEKKAAATEKLENLKASNIINKEKEIAKLNKELEGYKFENKKAEISILNDNKNALLSKEFELKEALKTVTIGLEKDASLELQNAKFALDKKIINIRADIKLNELGFSAELNEKSDLANHERTLQRDAINNNLKSEIESNRLALEKNKLEQKTANDKELLELKKKESELDGKRFELEAAAAKMLDVPGEDGAYVTWLSSNIELAERYANGETSGPQNNTIELVLNNLTATKSSWSSADGSFVDRPGGQISQDWQNAINARKAKFGTSQSLPNSALEKEVNLLPKITFTDEGKPDYTKFKDKDTFIFNGEDLSKSFGFNSAFTRFFNKVAGQIKDISGYGSGYAGLSGKNLSNADLALDRLATKIIGTARDELNGRVFALDLNLLQQDVEKFTGAALKSSVGARDALMATRNKIAISYNKVISMLNNPKDFLKTDVAKARDSKAGLESILGELTGAIALFERGIDGSDVGQAEAQTFQQQPTDNQTIYLDADRPR